MASAVRPIQSFRRTFFSVPEILRQASRKQHVERKILNFSQQQVYDVVSNVNDYYAFIPFCNHSHVYSARSDLHNAAKTIMKAELGVGFKLFEEKYMSEVTCEEPKLVRAVAADASLFKELITTWKFTPNVPLSAQRNPESVHHPSCIVDFDILFEFSSPLHAQASSVFFDQVSKMMLAAFVERCETVYKAKTT